MHNPKKAMHYEQVYCSCNWKVFFRQCEKSRHLPDTFWCQLYAVTVRCCVICYTLSLVLGAELTVIHYQWAGSSKAFVFDIARLID
jgi:hypothetical protein